MLSFLKAFLFKNLETKITALLLAVVVWVYLSFTTTESYETNARIQINNKEQFNGIFHLSSLRYVPIYDKIRVVVTGPRKDLKIIKQKELLCSISPNVDKDKKEIQQFTYIITDKDFNLYEFDNIKVEVIPEDEIRLEYIPFIEKTVQIVYPNPPFYQIGEEEYDIDMIEKPKMVGILVPLGEEEKLANKLKIFEGVPINQVSITGEGTLTIPLTLDTAKFGNDPHVQLKVNPRLKIHIEKKPVEVLLKNVEIKIFINNNHGIKNLTLSTPKCDIKVLLNKDVKDRITTANILCYCEITIDDQDLKQEKIQLETPLKAVITPTKELRSARIIRIIPESIDVSFEIVR